MANEVRKYYCNNSMKFNLDSMYTHLQCIKYDFEDKVITGEVEICGRKVDIDTIDDLIEEVGDLLGKAMWGKVTGREYGRIKAISQERQMIRYMTCLNAGMSERDAGYAFTD